MASADGNRSPTGRSVHPEFASWTAVCPAHFGQGAFLEGWTMTLAIGQRITLLKIDECLAMSHRYEMEVRRVLAPEAIGYQGRKTRFAVVRQRGKRKEFYLDLAHDDIVLDGWGQPFHTDTEGSGVFAGNACYNLVGDAKEIRQCIETKAVLPITDSAKAKIIVTATDRTTCGDEGQHLLYPDIDTHHAVVNRMKDHEPAA
jgi:hypothetical protein